MLEQSAVGSGNIRFGTLCCSFTLLWAVCSAILDGRVRACRGRGGVIDLRCLLLGVLPFVITVAAVSLLLTIVLISLMRTSGSVVLLTSVAITSGVRHYACRVSDWSNHKNHNESSTDLDRQAAPAHKLGQAGCTEHSDSYRTSAVPAGNLDVPS